MSGFYLLGLIAIWLFVGWLIYRFWRSATLIRDLNKIAYYVFGVVLFLIWFGSGFWPFAGKKIYYDAQVMAMCEKDGGIKVYEKVELPKGQFDKWGMVNFYRPSQGKNSLGPDYMLKPDKYYFRKKDPIVIRDHYQIFRRPDNRLLGETVLYGRGGGDLPGFWFGSNFSCPSDKDAGVNKLIKTIFIKSLED